jgi:hypothetical protein
MQSTNVFLEQDVKILMGKRGVHRLENKGFRILT